MSYPGEATGWMSESPSITAFALQWALRGVKNGLSRATDGASGPIENDTLVETIWREYPALPFPALRFPTHPTQLFGTEDLVIEVNGSAWLTATALTDDALERFLESVSDIFTPDAT